MKKTTSSNPSLLKTPPSLLWESEGVLYAFLTGYVVRPLRGNRLTSLGEKGEVFPSFKYQQQGFRVTWKAPPCDLSPSLYRLWDHTFRRGLIRLWVRRGPHYKGYWVQVVFPQYWKGEYLDSSTPFQLSFWA